MEFQSTFPRGERQNHVSNMTAEEAISIHVPAWGTTQAHLQGAEIIEISIHVPAWGTTFLNIQAWQCL